MIVITFNAEDYGAAPVSADNASAIQAGIDAVAADGGGALHFGPGIFTSSPFVLKDRVTIIGAGLAATELKLKDGSNTTFIKSVNFDALSGQNKWSAADGVPSYLGIEAMRINGNKANQNAGDGVKLYAKGIYPRNVTIFNVFGVGLYTEAGENPSVSSWPTLPEGDAAGLTISGCGSHGWHMRGPHDQLVTSLLTCLNGGDGLRAESASGQYLATADFSFIHSYANTGKGLNAINSTVRASLARLENNAQEGLFLNNADNCHISTLHLFDNARVSGDAQCIIDVNSTSNIIGDVICRSSGRTAAGGIKVRGNSNKISGVIRGDVSGGGFSTGIGIDLDACGLNVVDVVVTDFAGTGGIGMRTQQTSQLYWCKINAVVSNCATLWRNGVVGANNRIDVNGVANVGQTQFSGVGPNTGNLRELFKVDLWKSGAPTVQY